jgi:hypothetical protein
MPQYAGDRLYSDTIVRHAALHVIRLVHLRFRNSVHAIRLTADDPAHGVSALTFSEFFGIADRGPNPSRSSPKLLQRSLAGPDGSGSGRRFSCLAFLTRLLRGGITRASHEE